MVKWIEIIAEASVNVSVSLKDRYQEIAWRAIKGLRNIVVHEYSGSKFDVIWEVITEHLPMLKNRFYQSLLKNFKLCIY